MAEPHITLDAFRAETRRWLEQHLEPRPPDDGQVQWGEGSDSVALFRNLTIEQERAHIDAHRRWIQCKADAGFANISWSAEWGGRDLPRAFERAFFEEEARFEVPPGHEVIGITTHLIESAWV